MRRRRVYEPETEEEVIRLMQKAIGEGWQLRVVGSGISPNALGFSSKCMLSMAHMDKILDIDVEKQQVCCSLWPWRDAMHMGVCTAALWQRANLARASLAASSASS